MPGNILRRRGVNLMMSLLVCVPTLVRAQVVFEFNLPVQPLEQSLREVASKAHVTVAFAPTLVAGKRAPLLQGSFTLQNALGALLKNSGLRVRETAAGSFWIELIDEREPSRH